MATPAAALKAMSKICGALPDTAEKPHYGSRCYCVGKRIFATCGERKGVFQVAVQLESAHVASLLAADERFHKYDRLKDVVWIDVKDIKKWDEIAPLVMESYRLNEAPPVRKRAAKKTPKKRKK